jgi:ABC-type multidrug transport system ATPase subunit
MQPAGSHGDSTAPRPVLRLEGVTRRWGERTVVDGVDLEIPAGCLVRITGANGTGKTTLLRVASGIVRPDSGTIRLDGLDSEADRPRFRAQLGFASAGDHALYPRLSPLRHLRFCADVALMERSAGREAVDRAMREFAMEDFGDRYAQRLSLGQRQRLRLAIAFLHSPRLVLLDEPTNSLDGLGLEILSRALAQLRERGGAAVCCAPVTADLPLGFDRSFVLDQGTLHPA